MLTEALFFAAATQDDEIHSLNVRNDLPISSGLKALTNWGAVGRRLF